MPIYWDSRAKFFSWATCKHDFGPYPSDRELFYDIAFFVVRLIRERAAFDEEEDKEEKKDREIARHHCVPLIMASLPLIVSFRIDFLFRSGKKRHHHFVHRMDEKIDNIDRIRPTLQKPFSKLLNFHTHAALHLVMSVGLSVCLSV